jgi:predicted AAA+ superfamily ATPase
MGHPIAGASWEGFVIETLLAMVPDALASFYRTAAGAEVDLVLDMGSKQGRWVIEVKRGLAPKVTRGFFNALEDLQPDRSFVVYSGQERYALAESVEVIGLPELASFFLDRE